MFSLHEANARLHMPPHGSLMRTVPTHPSARPLAPRAGTTKRPVPLQHNLYYAGQLYTICQGEAYQMQVGGSLV